MSSDTTEGLQTLPASLRRTLVRRGLALEYATLSWNVVGCVIVIAAAIAGRIANQPLISTELKRVARGASRLP